MAGWLDSLALALARRSQAPGRGQLRPVPERGSSRADLLALGADKAAGLVPALELPERLAVAADVPITRHVAVRALGLAVVAGALVRGVRPDTGLAAPSDCVKDCIVNSFRRHEAEVKNCVRPLSWWEIGKSHFCWLDSIGNTAARNRACDKCCDPSCYGP